MSAIDPALAIHAPSVPLALPVLRLESAPRPFMKGGIVIAGVCGLISGMASANSIYLPLPFSALVTWAFAGGVVGTAAGAALGFIIDELIVRSRRVGPALRR